RAPDRRGRGRFAGGRRVARGGARPQGPGCDRAGGAGGDLQHRRRVALSGLTRLYLGTSHYAHRHLRSVSRRQRRYDPGRAPVRRRPRFLARAAPGTPRSGGRRRHASGDQSVRRGCEAGRVLDPAPAPRAPRRRAGAAAPATALLLEGLEIATGGPVEGEATTPTGAALVRVLSAGAPPARWRLVQSGWGAGQRDPKGYANALRLLIAEQAAEVARVVLIAADVDDMSPEYVEPLRQALATAGALDVQTWPVPMKKGRAGFRIGGGGAGAR